MNDLDQPLWAVRDITGALFCHDAPTGRRLVLWTSPDAARTRCPGAIYEEWPAWMWALTAQVEEMELEIHE